MDDTVLPAPTLPAVAAAVGAIFQGGARSTRMRQERKDRRSARRRRRITRQYRRERPGLGE